MIRRVVCLLLLLLTFACSSSRNSSPPPIVPALGAVGYDTLAVQHPSFPVPYILEEIESLPYYVGGNLDWTFGESLTNIEAILNSKKVIAWRVHFFNGPGLRNAQLGSYEPTRGMSVQSFDSLWRNGGGGLASFLRDRVTLYCELFAKHPETTLYISPTLEHNLSEQGFRAQESVVKNACPSAIIVNNPMNNGLLSGVVNEGHGTSYGGPEGSIVSTDGVEAMDANIPAYISSHQQMKFIFLWSYPFNGRCEEKFQDPRERTRWASESMIKDLFIYPKPLPEAPPAAFPIVSPRIWKPWAEDKCEGDGRANKPVYITPYKGSEIKILSGDNTPIGSLKYYGTFEGGGHRYYSALGSGDSGASLARKSFEASGNEWVYLVEGGVKFGPFHPSMRQGVMK